MNKITGTFAGKRIVDSGSENTLDYLVYEFTNIKGDNGQSFGNKWIKSTELLEHASLVIGKKYMITLSDSITDEYSKLSYPIEIYDGANTFTRKGGSIRKTNKAGKEFNLSNPEGNKKEPGIVALEKLSRDKMTEGDLLKQNKKGIFFCIHLDIKKQTRISLSNPDKGNYILIERKTQKEIDIAKEDLKNRYSDFIKHFKISQ